MKYLIQFTALLSILLVYIQSPAPAQAEQSLEQTRKLLEKGLSIHELDKEIDRLAKREASVASKLEETGEQIERQHAMVEQSRKHAAGILRSYYMGERDSIWLLLLSARSLSDGLTIYEYIKLILDNDRRLLDKHQQALAELKSLRNQLTEQQHQLRQIKEQFIAEKYRLVKLQEELDRELALKTAAAAIKFQEELDRLTEGWETKGLPLFKTYFQALANTMSSVPEVSLGDDHLTVDGSEYVFRITDDVLNTFLRQKNPMFNQLAFRFEKGKMIASGKQDDVAIEIKGHYKVVQEPENRVSFHVDDLIYNGFALPDTTRKELEAQFPLSFYPQKYTSFLYATEVECANGELMVRMKLNF